MAVDPLTSSGTSSSKSTAIPPGDLLPFLNDLASGFASDTLADVLTPTLSLFFQEWFQLSPTPDLLGNEWRRYLGAVAVLVQVKGIAALVSHH
jgi:ubiquitin conjugation factor E4 B